MIGSSSLCGTNRKKYDTEVIEGDQCMPSELPESLFLIWFARVIWYMSSPWKGLFVILQKMNALSTPNQANGIAAQKKSSFLNDILKFSRDRAQNGQNRQKTAMYRLMVVSL